MNLSDINITKDPIEIKFVSTAQKRISTHYIGVTMTTMASQITSLTVVYSIVYSGVDQRKHHDKFRDIPVAKSDYRKVSNIRRAKFQYLNDSHLDLQSSLPNPLQQGVKLRMKM